MCKKRGGGQNASNAESSVDSQSLKHKLIIGDNYPALLNLLISYQNRVKVIYIDPPYGKDDMGNFAQTNYDNAITRDNLLSMLYPRLQLARELLREDGVIFCSIDDRNQAYVKCLFDEVFGEGNFVSCVPRIIKKGGKSTTTMQKNHDYILVYTKNKGLVDNFSLEDRDESTFTLEDEFVEKRGKYKLTQTLDYSSLQYSKNMDYKIEIDGRVFYAGGSEKQYLERINGIHKTTDWVWRWSKGAVEWGIKNGFVVVKGDRIYTKTYLNCKKANGKNEIEYFDSGKPFTTLSFLENENSNDNGKKDLDSILAVGNINAPFKNPKPIKLLMNLIKMVSQSNQRDISGLKSPQYDNAESQNDKGRKILDEKSGLCSLKQGSRIDAFTDEAKGELHDLSLKDKPLEEGDIVLDFFAGSGTTAHAVLELNREDGGNRTFILVTNNEIADLNPNGIAHDVTTKRLKRIMSGECYDGDKNFKWLEKNAPYGGILEVSEIKEVSIYESETGKNAFEVIDERLYGLEPFENLKDKIAWVCENFSHATKTLKMQKDNKEMNEAEWEAYLKAKKAGNSNDTSSD
ncbi:site-specific DNA-methyltransferase [Helicobacter sp. MIT 05-5293]|uniref:site-specific DNA-methyltransferase n=1 Tax=Helicobacter sp. MIT 05-5293 TaxID=1548149 RepID=UPI0010FF21F4|nr:site-specific DNA-methyltransferase [Helicobacter sp. MIT 05-5293]TLD80905.1 site-specific DNA-methyltransferase [Helicobacter sp. MIT 05-5293]